MNRTKKFMYNTIAGAAQQFILMITGFIIPRVILVQYGSEINGLSASIMQLISYFTLVESGIGAAAIYSLYRPLAQDDKQKISGIVSAAKRFYIISGYIFSSLVFLLSLVFPLFRTTSTLPSLHIGILVLVLGTSGALDFFTLSKYDVILRADQKSYVVSIACSASIIVSTIIIITLAQFELNIAIVRAIALVSVLFKSMILSCYVKRKYTYLSYDETPDNSALEKRWDALILQILRAVHAGAPIIIITIFLGYQAVSVYTIYHLVIGGTNAILGIFVNNLSDSFGDIIARNEKKTLQVAYNQFEFSYYAMITAVYACAMILTMPFIRIYTHGITDTNYDLPVVGFLMVLNGLLYNLMNPQDMLVISAGLYKETKVQTLIQGLITILVGVLLAPILGLPGVLLGSILANIYRNIDLLLFIPSNVTGLSPMYTFKRWTFIFLELACISLPFIIFPIRPESIYSWIFYAMLIFTFSCVIVMIFSLILDKKELKTSYKRVKTMVAKSNG